MALIAILALGMTSLASIEIRRTAQIDHAALARTNARLALIQAIGQLQESMGPDQRVSASASVLGADLVQPHWTGVWRTNRSDGNSFLKRDDLAGGLSDSRPASAATAGNEVMRWLVSGSGDPKSGPAADAVTLDDTHPTSKVRAGKIPLRNPVGGISGHLAWWTGDLGIRANIRTGNSNGEPQSRVWRSLVASGSADPRMMAGNASFSDADIRRLATPSTTRLTPAGEPWTRNHHFDFTVDSLGVLCDTRQGGLKRDLTAYFQSDGTVAAWRGLNGLADGDPIVDESAGPAMRLAGVSPRFGLLRDWARSAVPVKVAMVPSRAPESDPAAGMVSQANSLANEEPVKLNGNWKSGLQPILVEATNFIHLSTFRLPDASPPQYQLRHHHYPRVVLWNPYNVELVFDRSMIMIQGNGRQEMWTENIHMDSTGKIIFRSQSQWLSFEGGRSTSFNASGREILNTQGFNDPYIGSYYFSIPKTRFGPGECLVFSPKQQAEYDCLSPYRPGPYNLDANELSCETSPDPARSYYISGTDIGGGIPFLPVTFWYAPTPAWSANGRNGIENQGDDTRAILKLNPGGNAVTFEDFDKLPQVAVVSASLQYGAGREPRVAWSTTQKMPMELLDRSNPRPTVIPNVRTREGVRLRWFREHLSNIRNSGPLANTPFFDEALLANWNPRAAFTVRSPWDNIGGSLPKSGSVGGPWFFGAYTRDLFDQAVSWEEQTPVFRGGRSHGNPFGPPQEGYERYVLFDVPRSETGVISLAQLQHVKLSELVWHPSFAIGNSRVDPRLGSTGTSGIHRTAPAAADSTSARFGGFHENQLGSSTDTQRASNRSAWASTARAILGDLPSTDNLVYDLSFEANLALWDRYFLSSGSVSEKAAWLSDPHQYPLPNSRMQPTGPGVKIDQVTSFHQAASAMWVDGAFNINSTSVDAWKAVLGSSRLTGLATDDNIPFPRVLNSPHGAWKNGDATDTNKVWAGRRELTPGEIDQLANAIVREVRTRGPFLSMADFVNRRLAENQTGRMGALEAAIEKSGLNSGLIAAYPLANQSPLPDYKHPDNIPDATPMEQTLKPASKAWGAPAWLTQADVLQVIGPALSARSDTFVIRAFGDALNANGNVAARAWCEAVVQRTPQPVSPDASGINPDLTNTKTDFGRRFAITSFRWLPPQQDF
jgi:hypothetical protein